MFTASSRLLTAETDSSVHKPSKVAYTFHEMLRQTLESFSDTFKVRLNGN